MESESWAALRLGLKSIMNSALLFEDFAAHVLVQERGAWLQVACQLLLAVEECLHDAHGAR